MAILKIAKMGHPVLLKKAKKVKDPTSLKIRTLVNDMLETLHDLGGSGVGLAAPQVHVSLQVVIFEIPGENNDYKSKLTPKEKDELGELAELYLEAGNYSELYRILPDLNGVEPELLLKAARHHLVQGELDRARFYMQGALDRDAPDADVWAMARGPFRDAGRGLSLGQWMLEYAAQVSPDAPHTLRLDAFRQMLDAKVAPETLGDPAWVAEQFNAANFKDFRWFPLFSNVLFFFLLFLLSVNNIFFRESYSLFHMDLLGKLHTLFQLSIS